MLTKLPNKSHSRPILFSEEYGYGSTNMVTPEIMGFYEHGNIVVEISRGERPFHRGETLYGISGVKMKDGKRIRMGKCSLSMIEAEEIALAMLNGKEV